MITASVMKELKDYFPAKNQGSDSFVVCVGSYQYPTKKLAKAVPTKWSSTLKQDVGSTRIA